MMIEFMWWQVSHHNIGSSHFNLIECVKWVIHVLALIFLRWGHLFIVSGCVGANVSCYRFLGYSFCVQYYVCPVVADTIYSVWWTWPCHLHTAVHTSCTGRLCHLQFFKWLMSWGGKVFQWFFFSFELVIMSEIYHAMFCNCYILPHAGCLGYHGWLEWTGADPGSWERRGWTLRARSTRRFLKKILFINIHYNPLHLSS